MKVRENFFIGRGNFVLYVTQADEGLSKNHEHDLTIAKTF